MKFDNWNNWLDVEPGKPICEVLHKYDNTHFKFTHE